MGKSSSAPDPYATAAAQTQSNEQTAAYNAALNRTSQYTPYGNSVYTQTGKDSTGAPTWSNTITLTPQAQQQLDNQLKQNNQLSNIGFGLADQAQSTLGTPNPTAGPLTSNVSGGPLQYSLSNIGNIQNGLNTSGVPNLPNSNDYASQIQQAQDAAYKGQTQYLDPQFAQQQSDLTSQLANQGVQAGSNAYNQAQNLFGLQKQEAYGNAANNAVQTGNALQNQLFTQGINANQAGMSNAALAGNFANNAQQQAYGQAYQNAGLYNSAQGQAYSQGQQNAALNNSTQAQALQQAAYLKTLPLNELNALRSGTQIQNPTFSTAPSATAGQANVEGDVYNSAQMQNNASNNFLNGLFGLGSAAIFASDRRLKRDIKRIGETRSGLPLYEYRYLWSDRIRVGVIAQDLLKLKPEAVVRTPSGFMAVNYAAID